LLKNFITENIFPSKNIDVDMIKKFYLLKFFRMELILILQTRLFANFSKTKTF